MTDTTKPTSTQGCSVKLWDRANFRYFVSDEAVDVYHETNLTPRQLLERWKHWEHVADVTAKEAQIAVNAIREQRDELRNALDELFGASISRSENGLSEALTKARAALAKHGGV